MLISIDVHERLNYQQWLPNYFVFMFQFIQLIYLISL